MSQESKARRECKETSNVCFDDFTQKSVLKINIIKITTLEDVMENFLCWSFFFFHCLRSNRSWHEKYDIKNYHDQQNFFFAKCWFPILFFTTIKHDHPTHYVTFTFISINSMSISFFSKISFNSFFNVN